MFTSKRVLAWTVAVPLALLTACSEGECPVGTYKVRSVCRKLLDAEAEGVSTGERDSAAEPGAEGGTESTEDGGTGSESQDSGATSASASDSAVTSSADAGTNAMPPAIECDVSHPCVAGLVCSASKCVSACTQVQCDPNASCSVVGASPVCTCNSGFISMPGASGAVSCKSDVTCEQLNCDPNATCESQGQTRSCVCKQGYTGTGTSCSAVSCGTPTLTNGTANVTGTPTYGSMVSYACNPGYARQGAAVAMCGSDGRWSALPTCEPISCGDPGTPEQGAVATSNGTLFMSVATFTCTRGTLAGDRTRECQSNGRWSGSVPRCFYCGDGMVTGSEGCDPGVAGTTFWTCDPQTCLKRTAYAPCTGNTGTDPNLQGIGCAVGESCFGYCTRPCSAGCPLGPAQARTTFGCAPGAAATTPCVAYDCSSNADCPPGTICDSRRICTWCCTAAVCGDTGQCGAGLTCRPLTGSGNGPGRCAP
jgi:hypothetical protein